jgi:hypothetical protein
MADEVFASGSVVAPGAGAAIATLAAASLPAGKYKVEVVASVSGNAVADLGNMRLRRGGVDVASPMPHGASGQPGAPFVVDELALDGTQNLTVEAIGAGTAAIEYNATIQALRIASY